MVGVSVCLGGNISTTILLSFGGIYGSAVRII